MYHHGWRGCFDNSLSKSRTLISFLEGTLITAWPSVYNHIMSIGFDLHSIFHKYVLSLFLNDFWDISKITLPIFDLFLMDGEEVIIALLLKIIEINETHILSI